MTFLYDRLQSGERLWGAWCVLGSSITAEVAGLAGYDWVLIDNEHGFGDYLSLAAQLQAVSAAGSAPIVRIPWNDPVMIKRVLDLGVAGIMIPYVQSADEAYQAVRAMRYPPDGVRGVAALTRAARYGAGFAEYFKRSNRELLTVVQIETGAGVDAADAIAAVDGIDVLFVGPLDLSTSLGIQGQYENPHFTDAIDTVVAAAKKHGKASGILGFEPAMIPPMLERGMTFVAYDTDIGMITQGMKGNLAMLKDMV